MYIFEFSIVLKMSSLVQPISELCHFKYVTFRFLKYLEDCRHCYTLCPNSDIFTRKTSTHTISKDVILYMLHFDFFNILKNVVIVIHYVQTMVFLHEKSRLTVFIKMSLLF